MSGLSPDAADSALMALMYAYLLKAGDEVMIPDHSRRFGTGLTDSDHAALRPLYARAKRAADIALGRSFSQDIERGEVQSAEDAAAKGRKR